MRWITLALLAAAAAHPDALCAQENAAVAPRLTLEVRASSSATADSSVVLPQAGGRVFELRAPGVFEVRVRNAGKQAERARLWLLRGTEATQIWTGSVAAEGFTRTLPYRANASTEVLLLQWGTAVSSSAGGVAMEGANSALYYLISDSLQVARQAHAAVSYRAPAPELERAFDAAAEARKESFESLLQARSATRVLVGVPNFRALRIALQQMHEPGTALLMYAPAGDSLESWMITPEGELLRHVGGRVDDALFIVRSLRRALGVDVLQASRSPQARGVTLAVATAPARGPSLAQVTRSAAAVLYPSAFHAALRRAKHLVIVPAFDFGATPFAMLPHPAGGMTVDHATVVVAPSICDVVQVGHRVRYAELARQPFILGDPQYPTASAWIFPPLPGAAAEAEAVAGVFGSPWFSGAQASRALVQSRVADASLIYVATHGIASATDAMDGSFLQLADDASGGRWTAREIQSRPLRARLAILSACQTGLGMAHDGGIIGVARSFLNAGSSQVVMSLWNVDDEATKRLMLGFVAALREYPPPEALRRAMVQERARRGSRPALWASFTILGATW